MMRILFATLMVCATTTSASSTQAQPADAAEGAATSEKALAEAADDEGPSELSANDRRIYRALSEPGGMYARVLGSLTFGRGVRLNNPYRLQTQLGEGAESLSLTAPYMDLGFGVAFGPPNGWQHGGTVRLSVALEGIAQEALSFGYLAAYRPDGPWMLTGRLGGALLTRPDPNIGLELGVSGAYFLTGSLGLTLDVVGNLFYGAATYEVQYSVIPTVSMSAGLVVDYEVLP